LLWDCKKLIFYFTCYVQAVLSCVFVRKCVVFLFENVFNRVCVSILVWVRFWNRGAVSSEASSGLYMTTNNLWLVIIYLWIIPIIPCVNCVFYENIMMPWIKLTSYWIVDYELLSLLISGVCGWRRRWRADRIWLVSPSSPSRACSAVENIGSTVSL